MLCIRVLKSPPGKSVLPILPLNNTSPAIMKLSNLFNKQICPGECPGVNIISSMLFPNLI